MNRPVVRRIQRPTPKTTLCKTGTQHIATETSSSYIPFNSSSLETNDTAEAEIPSGVSIKTNHSGQPGKRRKERISLDELDNNLKNQDFRTIKRCPMQNRRQHGLVTLSSLGVTCSP